MNVRHVAGLALGYALVAIALVTAGNAARIIALGFLGSLLVTRIVFYTMVNLGIALVVGTGGYVAIQRARRIGGGYGVDLDWGRVLGP